MTATLGVCVFPEPAKNAPRTVRHANYIHEILGHAGLCYETLDFEALPTAFQNGLRVLLTIGEYALPDNIKASLTAWLESGGAWLSIAGLCDMDEVLGAAPVAPSYVFWGGNLRSLGEGFLQVTQEAHPVCHNLSRPLHFFGGITVEATSAPCLAKVLDAHGNPTATPALLENRKGAGRTLLLAPDVTGTVVHIQQGIAVTRDGVSAPDGTAPVNDGILKSDDGQVLDWLLDRDAVPGVPGLRLFSQPIADQWQSLLLRALFYLAKQQNAALPLLWYYPDNLPALGHLSLDSDGNDPKQAYRLLEVLEQAKIAATWCIICPGYEREVIESIEQGGHELAMHFDALSDDCLWTEEQFEHQWRQLGELFGSMPETNKNHYLRWEGDTEFFMWCSKRGFMMDQSKGASKTGEAGFNFGTCHPYRPVTPDDTVLPVYELTTPTQDLLIFAPAEIAPLLLEAVLEQHGILHLLFHPAHIEKEGVADALLTAVALGKARGMPWWTAQDITKWEMARRSATWSSFSGGATLTASPDAPLSHATLLVLAPKASELKINGEVVETSCVKRWGFSFHSIVCDINAGESLQIEVSL
jgi:peptidoglycan/xylan/chitin deacetylase (PgdA/CDA1 family)